MFSDQGNGVNQAQLTPKQMGEILNAVLYQTFGKTVNAGLENQNIAMDTKLLKLQRELQYRTSGLEERVTYIERARRNPEFRWGEFVADSTIGGVSDVFIIKICCILHSNNVQLICFATMTFALLLIPDRVRKRKAPAYS
jgi:hypothetical protein